METELKFVLDAEGAARLRSDLGLPSDGRRLRSVYFDTPELELKSAGFTLRVREDGETCVQAVKQANGSLFTRHEWETNVEGAVLDFDAISQTPLGAKLGRKRRERLAPAFEVDVTRSKRELEFEGALIEVALDEGEVRTVGQRTPIRELELELRSGAASALFGLARTLGPGNPTLSFLTKSARGFALARDGRTCATAFAPPALNRDMTARDGFRALAAAGLMQIAANGEVMRKTYDGEAAHQLRVGARRLRSALLLFRPLVAEATRETVMTELRWLAQTCGPARDLDVFTRETFGLALAAETQPDPYDAFGAALRKRQAKAHRQAREAVSSARFRALLLEGAAWIEDGAWRRDPDHAAAQTMALADYAPAALSRALKRVLKRADALKGEDAAPRHRLRVADKSLRYAANVFAPLFPEAGARRVKTFIAAATEVQDRLGALTDSVSGHALCADLAASEGARDPSVAFAAGLIAGRLDIGQEDRLKAARAAMRRLTRAEPFW